MNGYIKLHRSILEWEWITDPITVTVWIYCLARANYEVARWEGLILQPGQFVTSIRHIAEDLGLSVQNVQTALKHLKSTNELTSKSTNKYTVITIEKWTMYQTAGEKVINKVINTLTNDQQTTNKQLMTDKEYKEIKERKEDINYNTADMMRLCHERFLEAQNEQR